MKKGRLENAQIAVVCLGLAFLGFVYRVVGDGTVWGAWIAIVPPVLVAGLALPTAIRLRSWTIAAVATLFLGLASEWPRYDRGSTVTVDETVRLVSWNIGAGNSAWASAVAPLEPDIVLVQESSTPLTDWDGFSWAGTPDPGTLTRFPFEILPTEKVGPWTEPQLLLLDVGGKKVLVANVRLMLPSAVIQLVAPFEQNALDNYRARVEQYEKLATLASSAAEASGADAIILAGDFNIPARMQSLAPIRELLRDAWLEAGVGWGATVPEFLPLTRIDHVWVGGAITVHTARVERLAGSDHRAVVVDLSIAD